MNNELGYAIREAKLSLGVLIERTKAQEDRIKLLEAKIVDLKEELEGAYNAADDGTYHD